MSTSPENTDSPAPGKPAAIQNLEQHEVPEVLNFLKENGVAIVIGVVLAVAGFVGYTAWKNTRVAKEDNAATLLMSSVTIPQFQEIIANYSGTQAEPLAYLSLAAAYFENEQYDAARQTWVDFQSKFPKHSMEPLAALGIAQAMEASDQFADAIAAYDRFLAQYPTHFRASSAVFGKGRSLEALGRFDEAIAIYEAFIAENPGSRWASRAATSIDFVTMQQRAATP